MSQAVKDGTGHGFEAEVNAENELVVRAITEAEIEHASGRLGTAYSWYSGSTQDLGAGATFLFVRNDGDVPLIMDRLTILGSNVICTWAILLGNAIPGPAGGTVVTPTNMNNARAGKLASSTSRTGETAVADGTLSEEVITAITVTHHHTLEGYILEKGQYMQINQVTESDAGSVGIVGHFENPS